MAHQVRFQQERGKDISTIIQESTAEFERRWAAMEVRLHLISGKDFIALLSSHFQKKYGMSITVNMLFDVKLMMISKRSWPNSINSVLRNRSQIA
jgi:hypothetical protein